MKSNKIHVKENQSLTLTCESEGMEFVRLENRKAQPRVELEIRLEDN